MNYSSKGKLQIKATSAGGALPVEGVNIRITGTDEGNIGTDRSVLTGRDGLTPIVTLPAPNPKLSQKQGSPEQVYSLYDVYAYKEGYYPKKITGVTIFGDVRSLLTLNMIPDAGLIRNTNAPLGNNSIITENEDLN